MAAYFGLVTQAAQGHADELAPQRPRDGLPQAGLAHARRADKAQYHALALAPDVVIDCFLRPFCRAFMAQLAHGQVFQDAVLDVFQVIVVFVQHLAGVGDFQVVVGVRGPGQAGQPVQIGADHAILGRGSGQLGQAVQFAPGFFFGLLGHAALLYLGPKFFDLYLLLVALAQFALDGLDLLAQKVLALHLFHLRLSFGLYLAPQFQHLALPGQQAHEYVGLVHHVVLFEDFLGHLQVYAHKVCHRVKQLARVLDVDGHDDQFVGDAGRKGDNGAKALGDVAAQGFDFGGIFDDVGDHLHPRLQIRLGLDVFQDTDALQAAHDEADGAVRSLEGTMNGNGRPHAVRVFRHGHFYFGVPAGNQADDLVCGDGFIYQAHRAFLTNVQRLRGQRINHHAAQRQNGDDFGNLFQQGFFGVFYFGHIVYAVRRFVLF